MNRMLRGSSDLVRLCCRRRMEESEVHVHGSQELTMYGVVKERETGGGARAVKEWSASSRCSCKIALLQ